MSAPPSATSKARPSARSIRRSPSSTSRPRSPASAPKSPTRCSPSWWAPAASPSSSSMPRRACSTSFLSTAKIRSQGDAALGVIMGTNWTADLDNAANKKFVASFTAKYNRLPATFAALGYDAIKLIDSAVADVGGKIENKDAVRAALRKANFQSVRGAFKFNNNHFPIQNLYIMEVKKDENGNLKAALKDIAIKDWQDPYHQECPMKW